VISGLRDEKALYMKFSKRYEDIYELIKSGLPFKKIGEKYSMSGEMA
jgi:hypothetical protein